MNNTMKHIFKTLAALFVGLLTVLSCEDKRFEMDLPLAVNSHKLSLNKEAGSTHILIYADGPWTAGFDKTVDWASLNKLSGSGNNEIVLTFSANYGISRTVGIILTKAELKDTIKVVQDGELTIAGESGHDDAGFAFKVPAVTLLKGGADIKTPVTTNLRYSLDQVTPSVEYFDLEGNSLGVVTGGEVPDTLKTLPWVEFTSLSTGWAGYSVTENNGSEPRTAVLTLRVEDANGNILSTVQTITQTLSSPELDLVSKEGEYAGFSGEYTAETSVNNVYPYVGDFQYEVAYEGGAEPWIDGVQMTSEGLVFNVTKNETGADRRATINVTYALKGGTVTTSYKVSQKSYPSSISFGEVRALAPGELAVKQYIEGFIVSDPGSANVCQSPQTAQFKFDFEENYKTAYIESLDGKYGFQLKFKTRADNTTERWQKVRVNLEGLTLVKETAPATCYTLTGLTAESIIEVIGTPDEFLVPAKKKSVSQLTDDDIFTMVSLQDIEIMCKDGAYTNATDGYSIKDAAKGINPLSGTTSPRWDCAPLLMSDKGGNVIYMLTNAYVPWRRDGTFYGNGTEVVAQGSGTYRGIIVAEELVRYGDLGRYKIRPMDRADIQLENPAFSKTIVEWNWNDKVADVVPEIGEGTLNLYGATTAANSDFNSMMSHEYDKKGQAGLVPSGALIVTRKWWNFAENRGEYFDISFSTKGITGSNMIFGLVWNHGQMNNTTLDSPAHWNLLYSIDGGATFQAVPGAGMIKNRSIVWWSTTSQDSCPGFKDHLRKLPQECFNQDQVILRVQVADKVTDTKPGTAAASYLTNVGIENGTLTDKATGIRIGTITVRYN